MEEEMQHVLIIDHTTGHVSIPVTPGMSLQEVIREALDSLQIPGNPAQFQLTDKDTGVVLTNGDPANRVESGKTLILSQPVQMGIQGPVYLNSKKSQKEKETCDIGKEQIFYVSNNLKMIVFKKCEDEKISFEDFKAGVINELDYNEAEKDNLIFYSNYYGSITRENWDHINQETNHIKIFRDIPLDNFYFE